MLSTFAKLFLRGAPAHPLHLGRSARTAIVAMALLIAVAVMTAAPPVYALRAVVAAYGDEKFHWKPLSDAILKLSGRPVKTWNLYEGDKKGELLLVQLGKRVLILDLKARVIYAPPPTDFPEISKGAEFESRGANNSDRQIPGTDWTRRDIGPAELVRVTLGDYGQTLELQIPHPIDFRGGIY
jgi:hypothetical protein